LPVQEVNLNIEGEEEHFLEKDDLDSDFEES